MNTKILKAGKNENGVRSFVPVSAGWNDSEGGNQEGSRGSPSLGSRKNRVTSPRGAERPRGPTRALRRFSLPLVSLSRVAYGVRFVQERKLLRFPGHDGTIMKIDSEASHANASAQREFKILPCYIFSLEV